MAQIYASEQDNVEEGAFSSSTSSSLSKHLTLNKSSHQSLPELALLLPEQSAIQANLILESSILNATLNQLIEDNNDDVLISAILDKLVVFNRFVMPAKTRQNILELYHNAVLPLMHNWQARVTQLAPLSHADYLKSVYALASLIDELAIAYKILLMEAYENGSHPKSTEPFLLAISRAAEYSSLYILHSYSFLRTAPTEKLQTLHQLYLCCEAAKVLDIKISAKEDQIPLAFSTLYNQTILISIADPSRLSKMDILKFHQLMAPYTTKIKISSLTNKQKQSDDEALAVGHFIIDTASNNIPAALETASTETRKLPQSRLFNTHAVLTAIEAIFQQAANSIENDVYSAEILLLKKVAPHLNTSYQRQFERFTCKDKVHVNLIKGFNDIHQALQTDKSNQDNTWNIHNRGIGGIMVSAKAINNHQLDVGDFYGVFEDQQPPLLALVRWLRIDDDHNVAMGLELHRGHPVAVTATVENDTEKLPFLLLRDEKQADTLIATRELINTDQVLQLTEGDKTYIILIDTLIDNSLNYDHFRFTVV